MHGICQTNRQLIPGEIVTYKDKILFFDGYALRELNKEQQFHVLYYVQNENGNVLFRHKCVNIQNLNEVYEIQLTDEQLKKVEQEVGVPVFQEPNNNFFGFPLLYDTQNMKLNFMTHPEYMDFVKNEMYKLTGVPKELMEEEHFGLL